LRCPCTEAPASPARSAVASASTSASSPVELAQALCRGVFQRHRQALSLRLPALSASSVVASARALCRDVRPAPGRTPPASSGVASARALCRGVRTMQDTRCRQALPAAELCRCVRAEPGAQDAHRLPSDAAERTYGP
jgi:hypothetical protein